MTVYGTQLEQAMGHSRDRCVGHSSEKRKEKKKKKNNNSDMCVGHIMVRFRTHQGQMYGTHQGQVYGTHQEQVYWTHQEQVMGHTRDRCMAHTKDRYMGHTRDSLWDTPGTEHGTQQLDRQLRGTRQ